MLTILQGDCLERLRELPAESVHCCVTSPPYWGLRDYGHPGQIGLEPTVDEFIAKLVAVFREVRRVLKADGTCWVNMGDSYASGGGAGIQGTRGQRFGRRHTQETIDLGAKRYDPSRGLKPKDLIGQPWMLAFALRADGWYLRQDIIWHKPNPMPESVTDRCTKAHEYIFLLTKSERYFYDQGAIKEAASPDTHARYARGRSDSHKWADGGPGGQTIATNGPGSKFGRKLGDHSPIKNNGSFDAALAVMPESRNKRSVWTVPSAPFKDAHFATYPPDLIRPCILAGCPVGGTVIDPFGGSGTTAEVAIEEGRKAIVIELNPAYISLIKRRTAVTGGLGL